MGKRKRYNSRNDYRGQETGKQEKGNGWSGEGSVKLQSYTYIQIIVGTYERVLHGITLSIPSALLQKTLLTDVGEPRYSNTFLFQAHASSIRSLALSLPAEPESDSYQRIILATGGSDERINLYHLTTQPPPSISTPPAPALSSLAINQNPQNRALGSLLHHSGTVTALKFTSKGKLLSGAADNTIAVTRTRDWTVLSFMKVPLPKLVGRPSGDTAGLGDVPAGVNSFAVHPSSRLMISVCRGDRHMRLWNLMTGKKAGVLTFDRRLSRETKEGKWTHSEGQKVEWGPDGEEFAVAFTWGAVIFGIDCKPIAKLLPTPMSKLHQIRYLPHSKLNNCARIIALSTEDGRVLFYNTKKRTDTVEEIPHAQAVAQLFNIPADSNSRIKDFHILRTPFERLIIITGSSDGNIHTWSLDPNELIITDVRHDTIDSALSNGKNGHSAQNSECEIYQDQAKVREIGQHLGKFETGNRITCLTSFVMRDISSDNKAHEIVTTPKD